MLGRPCIKVASSLAIDSRVRGPIKGHSSCASFVLTSGPFLLSRRRSPGKSKSLRRRVAVCVSFSSGEEGTVRDETKSTLEEDERRRKEEEEDREEER